MSYNRRTDDDGRPSLPLTPEAAQRYNHLQDSNSNYTKLRLGSCSRHCLQWSLACGSLVISIISIIASCLVVWMMLQPEISEEANNICVSCNKIKSSSFPGENINYQILAKHEDDGELVCCASTPDQTEALFNLVAERKMKELEFSNRNSEPFNGNQFQGSTISAHVLMAGYDNPERTEGQKYVPVNLLPRRHLSHYSGVKLEHNRIIIETKGKYFLYSQIYFKVVYNTNFYNFSSDVLIHNVVRYSLYLPNNGKEDILNSKYTIKLNYTGKDHDFRSSFVSGIFNFNVGDEIFTTVTDTSLIARDPTTNFIGLFFLGKSE